MRPARRQGSSWSLRTYPLGDEFVEGAETGGLLELLLAEDIAESLLVGHHPGDELSFGVETVDEHITEFCESGFHRILEFGGVDGQDLADPDDGDALLAVELHELIKGGQDI